MNLLSRESGLLKVAAVSEIFLIWFKLCRYALYDLAKAATCISQGVVDGIGSPKSFISHKNMQYSQDVHLQVYILQTLHSMFSMFTETLQVPITYLHLTGVFFFFCLFFLKLAFGDQNPLLQGANIMHHKHGLQKVLELLHLGEGGSHNLAAVGHRVVHGGESFSEPTLVTESVKRAIEKAIPLAPLHNPPNLEVRSSPVSFTSK